MEKEPHTYKTYSKRRVSADMGRKKRKKENKKERENMAHGSGGIRQHPDTTNQ